MRTLEGTCNGKTITLDAPLDLPEGQRVVVQIQVVEEKPAAPRPQNDRRGTVDEGESIWAWLREFKNNDGEAVPEPSPKTEPAKHVDHCIYGMPVKEDEAQTLCGDVA